MSRLLLIGIVAAMMSGVPATDAMAQRDAGAKARGEFGTGFWNSQYRRSSGGAVYSQPRPRQTSGESYRRFSYQPIGIHAGDTVVLNGDNVKMMKGTNVVGSLPKGQKFEVTKVVNGWLGAVVEVDGQKLAGWVWHKNVALEQ